jgi:hypothetical protein
LVEVIDGEFGATVELSPGENSIPVVALDLAGNPTSQLLEVEYFTLPEVAITLPVDLSTIAATTVDVSGTVAEPRSRQEVCKRDQAAASSSVLIVSFATTLIPFRY